MYPLQFFTREFFGNTRFDEWPPNSPDLNPLDYPCMSGELSLNATRHFNQAKYQQRAEESFANNMG